MYDRIAHYYDLSHNRLTADIPFILQLAAEGQGPVLELGCGSGRLLAPLARAGRAVTGVDTSREMLDRARQRLAAEPADVRERVQLVHADATTLDLPDGQAAFGLALFSHNTFMHFDERGAAAAVRRTAALLRPGGQLFIDLDNPLALAAAADDPDFALEDVLRDAALGETIRQYTAYESVPGEQAVDVTWVYEAGDPPEEQTRARLRYHFLYPHQIELLFGLVGLQLAALYGDYDRRPFREDSERLLVLGRRPAPAA